MTIQISRSRRMLHDKSSLLILALTLLVTLALGDFFLPSSSSSASSSSSSSSFLLLSPCTAAPTSIHRHANYTLYPQANITGRTPPAELLKQYEPSTKSRSSSSPTPGSAGGRRQRGNGKRSLLDDSDVDDQDLNAPQVGPTQLRYETDDLSRRKILPYDLIPFVNSTDLDLDDVPVSPTNRTGAAHYTVEKLNLYDRLPEASLNAKMQHAHLITLDNPHRHFTFLEPVGGCGATTAEGGLAKTSVTAKAGKCRVATNAGFFDIASAASTKRVCYNGLVTHDGTFIQKQHTRIRTKQFRRNVHFGLTSHGYFFVGYPDDDIWKRHLRNDSKLTKDCDASDTLPILYETLTRTEEDWYFHTLLGGVLWLVRDGHSYINQSIADGEDLKVEKSSCPKVEGCRNDLDRDEHFIHLSAARTAIGHTAEGRLIILSVDGKSHDNFDHSVDTGEPPLERERDGVTLHDMAALLLSFGVVNAINLDGGGSATVVVDGLVANNPSDSRPFNTKDDPSAKSIAAAKGSQWKDTDEILSDERKVSTITCIHDDYEPEIPLPTIDPAELAKREKEKQDLQQANEQQKVVANDLTASLYYRNLALVLLTCVTFFLSCAFIIYYYRTRPMARSARMMDRGFNLVGVTELDSALEDDEDDLELSRAIEVEMGKVQQTRHMQHHSSSASSQPPPPARARVIPHASASTFLNTSLDASEDLSIHRNDVGGGVSTISSSSTTSSSPPINGVSAALHSNQRAIKKDRAKNKRHATHRDEDAASTNGLLKTIGTSSDHAQFELGLEEGEEEDEEDESQQQHMNEAESQA